MTASLAVFASGGGTNLQALLDHESSDPPWRIRLVVSDRQEAGALDRGRAAGKEVRFVPVAGRDTGEVAAELLEALRASEIDAILLAGYLRLVPRAVVRGYAGRILNIHPALLPAFGGKGMYGLRVHEAVLASGAGLSGVTVHFVDEEYDRGRILIQWPVPVLPGDRPADLQARILRIEHVLYPLAADHLGRALAAGVEAVPFRFPGRAFVPAGAGAEEDEVREALRRGFAG